MKKIFAAVLVAAMLLCASALAEVPTGWQEVQMPDVGAHFYIPADMEAEELTAEDAEEGCAYAAANDILGIAIYVEATEGDTLDDYAADLAEQNLTVEKNALKEAGLSFDHICYTDPADPTIAGVIFQGNDGNFYTFEAETEEGNADAAATFGMILATLSVM